MKTQTKINSLKLASGIASAIAVLITTGCATDQQQAAPTASIPLDDPSIVAQVRESFNTNREYPYAGVQITAVNGDVKLTGYVLSTWQKYNAAAIAARVPGVRVVDNHVKALNNDALTPAPSLAHE